RPSQLEGRLLAVLRARPRDAHRSSSIRRTLATLFAAVALIAVSAFRPVVKVAEAHTAKHFSPSLVRMTQKLGASADATLRAAPLSSLRGPDTPATPAIPATPATPSTPAAPRTPAALASPAFATGLFLASRHPDSTFEKSVPAHPGGTLELDLDTGGDVEINGIDDEHVGVSVSLGGRDGRETSVVLEGTDNTARLVTRYVGHSRERSSDNEFTIRVPKHFNVRLQSAGGHVSINGVDGSFTGTTGGGEISIDHATGDAELSTGGGGIHISNSHLDGSVSTGAGPVRFNHVTGGITGSSGFGEVTYDDSTVSMFGKRRMLPGERHRTRMERDSAMQESMRETMERARATMAESREAMERAFATMKRDSFRFEIDSSMKRAQRVMKRMRVKMLRRGNAFDSSGTWWTPDYDSLMELNLDAATRARDLVMIDKDGGDIQLGLAPHGARVATGGGAIIIGRSKGRVSASTGGGDIDIAEADGAAAATTGSGDVSLTMVGSEAHPINVSSGTGNVELVLPRGANATLDLETAYTENFGKHTKIKSDWPVDVTETDSWDASHGTPRKYVRVKQDIGHGGPLIRVRTVNGDIKLKQAK
ncbi:MAG: hypothetical protein JJD97_09755, partial [Gemmatimonadaceae bacterium]|nr:hypothetical protein [Gemmatimonadaceae bacterium]